MAQYEDISVVDLLVDGMNPRHERVSTQRQAISSLVRDAPDKFLRLASDIVDNGLSPLDPLLVMPNGKKGFIVLEGNRRAAALKILTNPDLAAGTGVEKAVKALSHRATGLSPDVRCVILQSREEAQHWLELRHTGENEGAGVVRWGAEQQQRFAGRRGSQADKAVVFADALAGAYASSPALLDRLAEVRRKRLTTLGRLLSDPDVRQKLGIEFDGDRLATYYPASALQKTFERILSDLAGELSVSELKTKHQRQDYTDRIREDLPKAGTRRPEAQPLAAAVSEKPPTKPKPPAPTPAPTRLFEGISLINASSRVQAILAELQRLDVDQFPNAASVLLRVVVDLMTAEVYEKKKWNQGEKLQKRVRKCLHLIDPTDKDKRYQAVMTGLQDATSFFAVDTLHAYVHNPRFHSSAADVRALAGGFSSFVVELDVIAVP